MTNTLAVWRVHAPPDAEATKIGKLYRQGKDSIVGSVRHFIAAGEKLTDVKASLKHGEWLAWLEANAEALGFDTRKTAAALMRAAAKCNARVTFDEAEALQISRQIWGHGAPVRGTAGTGENEWYTPPEYLDLARRVLGAIDLDPATSRQAQKLVQASKFFTVKDDGLRHDWHGRVWLNPPYAQPLIAQFVEKLLIEHLAGRVKAAILLTHNYTDTAWFQALAAAADAICFTKGRIRFVAADGALASPTQGQAFAYLGPDVGRFTDLFQAIGVVR